jgi:hypothetical protein
MEAYGVKQAGLDVFRLVLLSSGDEDLNYGMRFKLLVEEDILRVGLGEDFSLKITETARRAFRGLRRVRFLNRLRLTVGLMRRVRAHYMNYPETPEGFDEWSAGTAALFGEARSRIMG